MKIDGDSFAVDVSTKGVVTFSVKRYTDYTVGTSGMDVMDTPIYWAKVVSICNRAKAAYVAVNGVPD